MWHWPAQANGAGKSTLIKLLTGETEACEGAVWRHPNLRLAYVAQHAFHHVEKVRLTLPSKLVVVARASTPRILDYLSQPYALAASCG